VKDQIERRDDTEQIAARLRLEMAAWEEETRRLLEGLGSGGASSEAIPALLRLDELCRADAVVRSRLAAVEAGLEELGPEIEDARRELARRGHDREELLREAGAEDEAGYLMRLEAFEERKDLLRTIAEADARLRERTGHGAAAFLDELAAGEVDVWQGQLEQAQRLLATLREESIELVKRQGDVERRLRELEESADVVALETSLQGLRTELEDALRDWRVASLASTLVRETLSRFTRERQPFVLAEASEMFGKVTGGRYERILPSAEEDGLVLVTGEGKTKLPEHLSRGAMEQLYLCLRLGLAEEFSRRTESIPLVMDDVLVNFDEERRRITAELLAGFSRRHQVLLFTCHRDVVELLREIDPGVHVVTMSEGR